MSEDKSCIGRFWEVSEKEARGAPEIDDWTTDQKITTTYHGMRIVSHLCVLLYTLERISL